MSSLTLWLVLCASLALQSVAVSSQDLPVSGASLSALLIGQDDLPFDVVLWKYEPFPDGSPAFYRETWYGPPTGEHRTAHCTIRVGVYIVESPDRAVKGLEMELRAVPTPPREVSGAQPFASFSDRAWYGTNAHGGRPATGARLLFTRGNVGVDIHMGHRDGLDQELLLALAARISSKIDAAREVRPEPAPILPPSAEEMKVDLEGAWQMTSMSRLPGAGPRARIALQKGSGSPRDLFASRLAKGSYMIPLSCLAAILGTKATPKLTGTHASVVLEGRRLVFTQDKAQATVGGRTIDLGGPVRFKGKQVFVPFSVLDKALGYRVTWRKQGKVRVAVIGSRPKV